MEELGYGTLFLTAVYVLFLVLTLKMLVRDIGLAIHWGKILRKITEPLFRGKGKHGNDALLE